MARKIKERAIKSPGITIIGEGITEKYYFLHLKALRNYRYTCKPRNFTQQSLEEMQKQIDRVLADKGIAVCVFDADVARSNQAEKTKFEAMKKKYARNDDVVLCDSLPSIEFWFLIHFLNTNKYFETSNDVIHVLRRYLAGWSKHEDYLSKKKWVEDLLADSKLETARQRAEMFGMQGESYSNIYKAFKKFSEQVDS